LLIFVTPPILLAWVPLDRTALVLHPLLDSGAPRYGPALGRYSTDMLPYAVLLHMLAAGWAFTVPELHGQGGGGTADNGGDALLVQQGVEFVSEMRLGC